MIETKEQTPPLIEALKVSKVFSAKPGLHGASERRFVRAVDRVSLTINPGEIVGLVGESGSGKSTLGQLLIRLETPTAGTIRFDGTDITHLRGRKLRKKRRFMQIIFQDPVSSLNPRFTVRDTLTEAIRAHYPWMKKRKLNARLAAHLQMVGLPASSLDRYPKEFSGGERQRIAIARALAVDPKFIIADEPISALDLTSQNQVVNLIDSLRAELNVSFVFISHDLETVKELCGRVAVMYLGRIVELASARRLFQEPSHPYTRALLAATLSTDPDNKKKPFVLPGDAPSPQDPPKGCHFHPRCPSAEPRCRLMEPAIIEINPEHFAMCHLLSGEKKRP